MPCHAIADLATAPNNGAGRFIDDQATLINGVQGEQQAVSDVGSEIALNRHSRLFSVGSPARVL